MEHCEEQPGQTRNQLPDALLRYGPLLTVAGCTSQGLQLDMGGSFANWLVLAIFMGWLCRGLGNAYLEERARLVTAITGGPLLVVFVTALNFQGVHLFSFESETTAISNGFYRACLQQVLAMVAAVLLIILDTWRLTERPNTRVGQRMIAYKANFV